MVGVLVWLLFFFSELSEARGPSGKDWQTLITPHFRVHYTAPLEDYAKNVARSLERHRPPLEKFLLWTMPSPLDVVLSDSLDMANGFAANFPDTRMVLYAVPFESDSVLSFYGNWADELALHELTHIIANDTTRSFYRPLRSIFGSWVKPNGLQPLWLIEGLAVFAETEWSSAGRGRSPMLAKLVAGSTKRNSLLNSSELSIDRWNDGNEWWPGGSTPYLMGYLGMAALAGKDPSFPGKLSWQNAGDFPFQPNGQLEAVAGMDWHSLSSDLREKLSSLSRPPSPSAPCFLTKSGRDTGGHSISKDGWIYFSEEDFHHGSSLARVRTDAPCGEAVIERLVEKPWGGPSQVVVSPEGNRVIYSALRRTRGEFIWSELYEWSEGKTRRLTRNGRARDPAFSGDQLFYIRQNDDLTSSIVEWKSDTEAREVFRAQPLQRISQLYGAPGKLFFSWHQNKHLEQIYVLSLGDPQAKPILALNPTPSGSFQRHPINQGNALFYSLADSYGRWEARRFETTKKEESVLALPQVGFDRIIPINESQAIATVYHRKGFDLARIELNDFSSAKEPSKALERVDLHESLRGAQESRKEERLVGEESWTTKRYSPFSSMRNNLLPQYWLPELNLAIDGTLLGISTGGNDPLEYHSYGVLGQIDSRARFPSYNVFYLNRVYRLNWRLSATQWNTYFSNSKTSYRTAHYLFDTYLPLDGLWSVGLGVSFRERALFGIASQSLVIGQFVNWGEARASPSAMDPNEGMRANLQWAAFPNTRNEKLFFEGKTGGAIYLNGFHPSHSVGASFALGLTTNRSLSSNYFQGGGLQSVAPPEFMVRGYPTDALLGQKIFTFNTSYSLPIAQIYRGIGTLPIFLQRLGLRLAADVGSANFLASYEGSRFRRYSAAKWGHYLLPGAGLEFLAKGSAFYHVPFNIAWGLHRGFESRFGGETQIYFALGIGLWSERNGAQLKIEPSFD
jgi:hypothetical protein